MFCTVLDHPRTIAREIVEAFIAAAVHLQQDPNKRLEGRPNEWARVGKPDTGCMTFRVTPRGIRIVYVNVWASIARTEMALPADLVDAVADILEAMPAEIL